MAEMIDIENDDTEGEGQRESHAQSLISWVLGNTTVWKQARDSQYQSRWEEYYRLWRGIWAAQDKQRNTERSRLISPALQQAIESVASEIESAILEKPTLFDLVDNVQDAEKRDVAAISALLRERMDEADFETALNEIFLMGSIYGTGIGKLNSRTIKVQKIRQSSIGLEVDVEDRELVELIPVLPSEFIIDTAATSIDAALGVAHEFTAPRHEVIAMQRSGSYMKADLHASAATTDPILSDETRNQNDKNSVNMLEYHGKVPAGLLYRAQQDGEIDEEGYMKLFPDEGDRGETEMLDDDDNLVEAIVVIANSNTLLKAEENKSVLKDRRFIAYRHEIVPDQFWGRGVGEKGYNSQKGLDASLRARIDGLALTVHPMMGYDVGRMPKGFKFTVSPGKSVPTNGNPGEILHPFNFGQIDPNVFTNNAELERYVTMSTGGLDTSAPIVVNNRNETAAGMSMQLGNFVKRAKRTIRNIEREFIIPMVRKTHRMYMELDPEVFPAVDVKYKVISVLGTMARELEQQQYAHMLNTVQPGTTAFWMLMKSIYETSSLSNREELLPLIKQNIEKSMQPPPPDPLVELKRMEVEGKIRAEAARIQVEFIRAQAEIARAANDARTAQSEEAKLESEAILNLAKAEAAELGTQLQKYKAQVDALEADAAGQEGLANVVIERASRATAGGTEGIA